jgi:hypothetical protein
MNGTLVARPAEDSLVRGDAILSSLDVRVRLDLDDHRIVGKPRRRRGSCVGRPSNEASEA